MCAWMIRPSSKRPYRVRGTDIDPARVAVIKGCLVTGGGVRISGEIMNLRYSYGGCENGRHGGVREAKMRYLPRGKNFGSLTGV